MSVETLDSIKKMAVSARVNSADISKVFLISNYDNFYKYVQKNLFPNRRFSFNSIRFCPKAKAG